MSSHRKRWVGATIALATALVPGVVVAQNAGRVDRTLFGGDFSFNGLFRVETAFSTSGQISPANQYGLRSNGRPINRVAGNPLDQYRTTLAPGDIPGLGAVIDDLLGDPTVGNPRGVSNNLGVSDTITRYIDQRKQDLNYHLFRFEATPSISWGEWSLQTRIRAVYDPGELGYQDFNYNDYDDINGGFETGNRTAGRQYDSSPDYLGYEVDNKRNPIFFERSGKNYQVDLPAFFVQWTNGNVTARLGNQSVAWGQLLFFRIMDTANGLDLRRHLFIDRAIEEFADERASAPGLRVTWQATDQILVDAFAQQFIPTILTNSNTPYNIVDSRFIVHDEYYDDGAYKKLNYGIRFKAEFGNFNLQAMATSRLNQLGAISWEVSGINKALPNTNALGAVFNAFCQTAAYTAISGLPASPVGEGCGPQLAATPIEVGPLGLLSAEEWFDRAGYTKLSGLEGLNRLVRDFQPVTGGLLAAEAGRNVIAANNELDAFFIATEGIHGHVQREYFREEVYGLGGGVVVEAEPGSLLDQLIINVEATYTKDRTFTDIGLGNDYDIRDEYQFGLVMEKYQRFSQTFPATYMVFQYLWQKESSLEGLLLDGYGSENFSDQGVELTRGVPTKVNPDIDPGLPGGAHYLVFAALQPTDAYVYEFSFATLIDVQGGVLFQPAVQWKPRGDTTVNVFYNYITSDAWGDNKNDTFLSFIDFADELVVRIGYQF